MATRWVMTRLSSETRQRLDKAKERFLAGAEKGKRLTEIDCRNSEVSVDWIVRQLLDQLDQQRAREDRRKAKRLKPVTLADQASQ